MARRSKRTKKKTRFWTRGSAALASFSELAWMQGRPYLTAAAWTIGVTGLVLAWIRGVPELQASVAAAGWSDDVRIEFLDRPAWVRGDLLDLLEHTALRQVSGDPLRRADLTFAHEALLNTGWFNSIEQVRRVHADRIEVHAEFVTPAAVIRDADGDHLVTAEGWLLPRSYQHGAAAEQLVITGPALPRPQRPGMQWDGLDVYAALRLVLRVADTPWRDQIAAIDASSYATDERLVIVTDLGARIIWGSAPDDEQTLEVSAARKLAYLDRAYVDFGRIDTGYAGTLRFYDRGYFAE